MSTLSATSITFSDGTSISSYYSTYPLGSKSIFLQASAPTGWTQDTTSGINDTLMRNVNTTGGGVSSTGNLVSQVMSSSSPFSGTVSMTVSGLAAQSTTLTTTQLPSHAHGGPGGGAIFESNAVGATPSTPTVYNNPHNTSHTSTATGGGGSHTHPVSYTSASGPFSGTVNFAVNYYDCILCSLD